MNSFESTSPKRVSYILATKDRARFLEDVFPSIRALKKPTDELIIIDSCSADNTLDVIQRHVDIVDVLISEKDTSEGHAFNKGILLSQGKYIKLLTDDDVIYPEAMEQAVQVLKEHPEVDVLLCGGTRQKEGRSWLVYNPPGIDFGKETEDVFRYSTCGIGLVIRRSALAKTGLLNANAVSLDGDFLTQCIAKNMNVKFCRINMFYHPIYGHSGTIARQREYELDVNRICRQHCSTRFYLRFRLSKILHQHPLLHFIALPLRISYQIVRAFSGRNQPKNAAGKVEPIWDGGFS